MPKRVKLEDDAKSLIDRMRGLLAIDKHAIDDEIIQQPSRFFEVSEAAVLAAAVRDYKKARIKEIDAELYSKHRRKLEKDGKATEGTVNNAVSNDPKHIKAVDQHLDASKEADLLQALKEAFHQRSYMIRDLSALYIANYYEKTSVSSNVDSRDIKAKRNIDRMAEARNKRAKKSKTKRNRE